jgi:hypothetical protein
MSASEEMVREQLIRIIARTELRIEQLCIHINGLAPYGEEIKRKGGQLASMLAGLVKLKALRKEYPEPQTRARLPTLPVTSLIRPSASSGKRAGRFWPDGSRSRAQSE